MWHGGGYREAETLESAYFSALSLASENGVATIAFPSISTGAYRYPIAQAATVALRTCVEYLREHDDAPREVRFVLFSESDLAVYQEALRDLHGA